MFFSSRPARQLALAAGLLSFATLTACNKGDGDFAKTKSGIEYKIFKREGNGKYSFKQVANGEDPTAKDRQGKFLTGFLYYRTGKDSVLEDTRKKVGAAVPLPVMELKQKGGPEEAFRLLQPGDSGVFRFSADSLFRGNPVPSYLKKSGNVVVMHLATDKLIDEAAATALQQELQQKMMVKQQQEMAAHSTEQLKKDDVTLQDYMKKNNLTGMKKTPSGLYYQITKTGTGATPKAGQTVSVNYLGTTLGGKEFDSSAKHGGKPFEFPLGQGQVIPGWDEGIALLPKGSKAILLIPSTLAYGQRGAGADIPADSPLRFEVELVDVK